MPSTCAWSSQMMDSNQQGLESGYEKMATQWRKTSTRREFITEAINAEHENTYFGFWSDLVRNQYVLCRPSRFRTISILFTNNIFHSLNIIFNSYKLNKCYTVSSLMPPWYISQLSQGVDSKVVYLFLSMRRGWQNINWLTLNVCNR